jgi:hypothetical protein
VAIPGSIKFKLGLNKISFPKKIQEHTTKCLHFKVKTCPYNSVMEIVENSVRKAKNIDCIPHSSAPPKEAIRKEQNKVVSNVTVCFVDYACNRNTFVAGRCVLVTCMNIITALHSTV